MASYSEKEIDEVLGTVCTEMGYSEIRENQETVVKQFLGGKNVFVSLPTGSGKSLGYSILPSVFDKLKRSTGSFSSGYKS